MYASDFIQVLPPCPAKSRIRLLAFKRKIAMKDRFHYLQPAYNAVGAEAGQQVGSLWGR